MICNFTPMDRPDYRVGVPKKKQYTQLLDENGMTAKKVFKAEKQECDNRPFSFAYPLPAYGWRSSSIKTFCNQRIRNKNA